MKIVVYAICKNEAGYAERWMASMAEADGVYVLDTGSTDGTAERLRALGAVVVEERVEPWRFDTARNRSLELVPGDARSEERRVGKECRIGCRSRWSPYH